LPRARDQGYTPSHIYLSQLDCKVNETYIKEVGDRVSKTLFRLLIRTLYSERAKVCTNSRRLQHSSVCCLVYPKKSDL
jgi:hypothetical protein